MTNKKNNHHNNKENNLPPGFLGLMTSDLTQGEKRSNETGNKNNISLEEMKQRRDKK